MHRTRPVLALICAAACSSAPERRPAATPQASAPPDAAKTPAETASLQTLKQRLAAIDGVKDPKQLASLVGEHHQTGTRSFFVFRSTQDAKDATQVIGLADQGGLGLPDRDYYLKDDAKMQEARKRYREYAINMLKLLGTKDSDAQKQADIVIRIETDLARASMARVDRRDPYKVYHRL